MGNQEYELKNNLPLFVEEMKRKIEDSTEKFGDFTKWQMEDFFDHYFKEVGELNKEIDKNQFVFNYKGIMKECIDVANMVWFIWRTAREAHESLLKQEVGDG